MAGFVDFFKNEVPADPMKAEYLIPSGIVFAAMAGGYKGKSCKF